MVFSGAKKSRNDTKKYIPPAYPFPRSVIDHLDVPVLILDGPVRNVPHPLGAGEVQLVVSVRLDPPADLDGLDVAPSVTNLAVLVDPAVEPVVDLVHLVPLQSEPDALLGLLLRSWWRLYRQSRDSERSVRRIRLQLQGREAELFVQGLLRCPRFWQWRAFVTVAAVCVDISHGSGGNKPPSRPEPALHQGHDC